MGSTLSADCSSGTSYQFATCYYQYDSIARGSEESMLIYCGQGLKPPSLPKEEDYLFLKAKAALDPGEKVQDVILLQ